MTVLRKPKQWAKRVKKSIYGAADKRSHRPSWHIRTKRLRGNNQAALLTALFRSKTEPALLTSEQIECEVDRAGARKAGERLSKDTLRVEFRVISSIIADTVMKGVVGKERVSARVYPRLLRLVKKSTLMTMNLNSVLAAKRRKYGGQIPGDDMSKVRTGLAELGKIYQQIAELTDANTSTRIKGEIEELLGTIRTRVIPH